MGLTDKSSATSYVASLVVGLGSMSVNEVVAVAGLGLALATFVTNVIYKHLEYKMKKARYVPEKEDH